MRQKKGQVIPNDLGLLIHPDFFAQNSGPTGTSEFGLVIRDFSRAFCFAHAVTLTQVMPKMQHLLLAYRGVDRTSTYFGSGIDSAKPAPRSVNHNVSPAGSMPVGVFRPSLSTVTLALSPFTVIAAIMPLPFSAT